MPQFAPSTKPVARADDELIARAHALAGSGRRRLLGLTGPPGAGKSTLARALVAAVGPRARLVAMDGFHLAGAELARLGRAARKGAPDTFDVAGYVALLRRLRDPGPETVYAPEFRRAIEEPVAGAVAVEPEVPLVVTEGNYLLVDRGPWAAIRELLDEAWYLEAPDAVRLARLTARHEAFGKAPADARAWAHGPDQHNARLVARTRNRADLLVRLPGNP